MNFTSLVCQDRVCKLGWQWCITIQWSHVWDLGGYCACAFLLYLNPSAAVVFHFSSALSVHDWLIKCSVHLHDSVMCMPWDLNIKMNWILSCRVQFPVTRFCLFMEKLLAKRSQVKPCICYIVGKTVFSTFTMALVCLSTSAYPFCAFKLSKTVLFTHKLSSWVVCSVTCHAISVWLYSIYM